MFVNIVDKYGVVPKEVRCPKPKAPATPASMNEACSTTRCGRARPRYAATIPVRGRTRRHARRRRLDTLKAGLSHPVHPPRRSRLDTVDWQWRDRNGGLPPGRRADPAGFRRQVRIQPAYRDMVCLVNDPRPDHPYFQTYTIGYLGNVVGARSVRYLNVPIEIMKDVTRQPDRGWSSRLDGLRHRVSRITGRSDCGTPNLFDYAMPFTAPTSEWTRRRASSTARRR